MRGSESHSHPLPESMPSYDKNILRLLARLLSALDPECESITPDDRQLIEDVLHYGTFKHISAVRSIPIQTLSYRFSRLLDRLESIEDNARQNSDMSHRLAALEDKLAATEKRLEKLQQQCVRQKEQLKAARRYDLAKISGNLRDNLKIRLADLSLDKSTKRFLDSRDLHTIEDIVRLSKDDFRYVFGYTSRGLELEYRLRLMGLEVGMDLSEI